ncbi:MAG: alpha/beta fold hydrolase, partial [Sciscionella sp.]
MPQISPRARRWSLVFVLAVVLVAGVLVVVNSTGPTRNVATRQVGIDVTDGPRRDQRIRIDSTVYLPERTPAPAVLVSPGFGGSKQSVATEARELAKRGFVTLAYSPRGFGRTGGQIALNARDYEVADASQLIDWLARQPEVSKDSPGDPKVGVTGSSYGGALSLLLAGTDHRVDALAPVITYNDLAHALLPNAGTEARTLPATPAAGAFGGDGVFKQAWAGLLFATGAGGGLGGVGAEAPEAGSESDQSSGGTTGGGGGVSGDSAATAGQGAGAAMPAAGGQAGRGASPCGRFRPEICAAYTELATTGRASARTVALLRSLSPVSVTSRITAPTLLVQGEQDTLFGLDESDATARQITRAGGKVKTIWYAGGHDGGSPGPTLRGKIADWFDFHLRGNGADPGTGFDYDIQGSLRAQGAPTVRSVSATGYPGLTGQGTRRERVALSGAPQSVVNPPGGKPAAVSSLPGLISLLSGSSRLAGRIAIDLPGQTARFDSRPLDSQLLVTGSSRVRLRVSGRHGSSGGVLFAKLYDVSSDGTRTLPGSAVAPLRIPSLPAGGTVTLTVTLPGIVAPIEAGHRVELAVTTTDQSFSTPVQPTSYTVGLVDGGVTVPTVHGTAASTGPPTGTLLGIGGVLLAGLLGAVAAAFRRRRDSDIDPELEEVPLVIEDLSKFYRGGVTAADGLSFRVERGQVLGLLGPNGAGKTTTLRMLMGLVRPTDGSIRVFGHRISQGAPVLSRVGCFVEGSGFLPHLSGAENLRLYWASTGRPESAAHLTQAMEIAGLGDASWRRVRTYSQGMRQRLAIAQAMLGLPELLVLDEPTN